MKNTGMVEVGCHGRVTTQTPHTREFCFSLLSTIISEALSSATIEDFSSNCQHSRHQLVVLVLPHTCCCLLTAFNLILMLFSVRCLPFYPFLKRGDWWRGALKPARHDVAFSLDEISLFFQLKESFPANFSVGVTEWYRKMSFLV